MADDDDLPTTPRPRNRRGRDGAIPEEQLALVDSEVHALRARAIEDRAAMRDHDEESQERHRGLDHRLQAVEVRLAAVDANVSHVQRTLRLGVTFTSGLLGAVLAAVVAQLILRR